MKKKVYSCELGTADHRYIYARNNKKNQKCITMYYGTPNYDDSSMAVINGKLFFTGYNCRSGRAMGWQLLADEIEEYFINLKSKKTYKYATYKTKKDEQIE